jgi:hypothetical protein
MDNQEIQADTARAKVIIEADAKARQMQAAQAAQGGPSGAGAQQGAPNSPSGGGQPTP